uniref:RING-type E3 ubiquitin transferase n=1 Tax=Gouania willdenowi TaxID=441366 RepID=A0A8C5N5U6_GOUWI
MFNLTPLIHEIILYRSLTHWAAERVTLHMFSSITKHTQLCVVITWTKCSRDKVQRISEKLSQTAGNLKVLLWNILKTMCFLILWIQYVCSRKDNRPVIHERPSMVPFVLVGSDKTIVRVQDPLQASGDYMEKIHHRFYDLDDIIKYNINGVKPTRVLEMEKMLKVGTSLTGVGELIMETDGTLSLRPPTNGAQYLLSRGDLSSVKQRALSSTVWWRFGFGVCALAGGAGLSRMGFHYCRHLNAVWR